MTLSQKLRIVADKLDAGPLVKLVQCLRKLLTAELIHFATMR